MTMRRRSRDANPSPRGGGVRVAAVMAKPEALSFPYPNRAGAKGVGSTKTFWPVTISAIIRPVTAASVSP